MKKTRRLELTRETVAQLNLAHHRVAAGRITDYSCWASCPDFTAEFNCWVTEGRCWPTATQFGC